MPNHIRERIASLRELIRRGFIRRTSIKYYRYGVRKRPAFRTFQQAKDEADAVTGRLAVTDADILTLTSADRAAYLRARQLLDSLDLAIETAAAQFADARKALGDVPLSQSVEFYVK
jgi:hypothetical protein